MTERGVSEVLGFVLLFSMILLMTGVVYLGGASELREVRDDQQIEGVERAFVAIDSDVTDIVRDGAPSRSATIRLNGGTLAFEEPVQLNVTINGSGTRPRTVQPLVFRLNGEPKLAYVAGMTLRSGEGGGWAVVREPPTVVVGDSEPYESVLFPVVKTSGSGRAEGARSLTVVTRMERARVAAGERYRGNDITVRIGVHGTPRADAWERYLKSEFNAGNCGGTPATAANCSFRTDSFRSPTFPVNVAFN